MVRVAAMRRASERIVSAPTPVMEAAHSAFFGWASVAPIKYGSTRAKPSQ